MSDLMTPNRKLSDGDTPVVVTLVGLLLAIGRIWLGVNVEPDEFAWSQAFKDAAHLFMGGLGTAWWIQRQRWQCQLFWLLNLVEVLTAIFTRI